MVDVADAGIESLSIIGTAGRGDDLARLDRATYDRMAAVALHVLRTTGATRVVSGGAAFADHLAVRLVVDGHLPADRLTLHMPSAFSGGRFSEAEKDGSTSNWYHGRFSRKLGIDSLAEIADVVARGATLTAGRGFFDRNRRVALSDAILAFTFGGGEAWAMSVLGPEATGAQGGLKDGGTAYTYERARSKVKMHVSLG